MIRYKEYTKEEMHSLPDDHKAKIELNAKHDTETNTFIHREEYFGYLDFLKIVGLIVIWCVCAIACCLVINFIYKL